MGIFDDYNAKQSINFIAVAVDIEMRKGRRKSLIASDLIEAVFDFCAMVSPLTKDADPDNPRDCVLKTVDEFCKDVQKEADMITPNKSQDGYGELREFYRTVFFSARKRPESGQSVLDLLDPETNTVQ